MFKNNVRIPLDIVMTLLSIILMGGTMLFPNDKIHQVLGMLLLALWIIHIVLNGKWFSSLFKGAYKAYRIMQVVVNTGLLTCAIFLMISGLMMAWFIPPEISGALSFARTAHLLASHWYYIFMAAHIGLHASLIANKCLGKLTSPQAKVFCRLICVFISLYGVYALITRGFIKYMFLRQEFFFFDFEKGYILFAVDYIAILFLFATVSHYIHMLIMLIYKRTSKKDSF